jgi:hypothetical protein
MFGAIIEGFVAAASALKTGSATAPARLDT